MVQYFLNHSSSPYTIRAITRDPNSAKAQELSKTNVPIYQADLNNASSLKPALEGAHAIYLVTDFWAAGSAAVETQQAKNALDIAASIPTVEHVIWSSLPSITEISGGKYTHVWHSESKAEATKYVKESLPELWKKMTTLWVGGYYQIWVLMPFIFAPRKVGDDLWGIVLPMDKKVGIPMVDVRDTGMVARGIFAKGPAQLGGKTVRMLAEEMTLGARLTIWGRIVSKETAWKEISDEEFEKYLAGLGLPEPMAKNISDNIRAFRDLEGRIVHGKEIIMAKEVSNISFVTLCLC